ncbi:MAG: polysaccharide biosynthesis/export family protein [Kiritimatiellae bacterium]|nr:polysaccharide biosynthesis/export family protein [Kiritimatiellia bacterium]
MKRVCLWLILLVLVGLVGCSSQDFGRPIARIGDVVDSGQAYVEDSDSEEGMRRAQQLAQILAEWERQKATVDKDYTLGPDDVLTIGILSLEVPGEIAELTRAISKDGTVALPLVGAIPCAGMTARTFQDSIVEAYKGGYLQDPQVDVAVLEYLSASVVVTGAVGEPGVYYLRHNRSSVLQVLSMAGGLSLEAGNDLLIVRKRDSAGQREGEGGVAAPEPESVDIAPPVTEPEPATPEPWTGSHIVDLVNSMAAELDGESEPESWSGSRISERVAALEAEGAAAKAAAQEPADEAPEDTAVVEKKPTAADAEMIAADGEAITPAEDDAGGQASADLSGLDADLITVDLEALLDEGDIRLNLPIKGGDIVTVPPGRNEYVYVLGYVQRPGAFDLRGRRRVRALQAVAMAGGLSGAARAQNSFLVIDKPSGRQVISIDLTKIARGQRPPVYMESGHTLVVGSGVFARLAEFIKPSVTAGADLSPGP